MAGREERIGRMFLFFWTGERREAQREEKWKISKEEIRMNGDPGAGKFGGPGLAKTKSRIRKSKGKLLRREPLCPL